MATHSFSCLENPVDREAWWAADHGGHKELDITEATEHSTAQAQLWVLISLCLLTIGTNFEMGSILYLFPKCILFLSIKTENAFPELKIQLHFIS